MLHGSGEEPAPGTRAWKGAREARRRQQRIDLHVAHEHDELLGMQRRSERRGTIGSRRAVGDVGGEPQQLGIHCRRSAVIGHTSRSVGDDADDRGAVVKPAELALGTHDLSVTVEPGEGHAADRL